MKQKIPTTTYRATLNPDVCDVIEHEGARLTRVRHPNGSGQVIDEAHKNDPGKLQDALRRWLADHVAAAREEFKTTAGLDVRHEASQP